MGLKRRPSSALLQRFNLRRSGPVVIGLLGLLVMPTLVPYVGTGLDPSWATGLNMAAARGMAFGRDIVFTFGPLGFLASPSLTVPRFGVIAMLMRFGLSWGFGWLVARALMRGVWWPVAAACTWFLQWAVVGSASGGAETMLIPVLLLVLGLTEALFTRDRALGRIALAGCGLASATCLLTKFDTGLLCAVVIVGFLLSEAVVLQRGARDLVESIAWVTGGFAVSVVGWWVLLGQPLGGIHRWISTSIDAFVGYQTAMVADAPVQRGPLHSLVTVALVVAAGLGLAIVVGRDRRSVTTCLLLFGTLFIFAKQSFTRYDDGHLQRLYTCAAVVLVAIAAGLRRTRTGPVASAARSAARTAVRRPFSGVGLRRALRPAFTVLVLSGSLYCAKVGSDLVSALGPDTGSWRAVAKLALSAPERDAVITRQRTYLPPELSISPEVRSALSEGGVHIEPTETSVAWIFPEVRWKPLPVFQSYSAYTPGLDNLNARAYATRGGPDIVLYAGGYRVDDRVARFESPAAQLAFVCNFRPRVLTDRWQVFVRRDSGSGCAPTAQELGSVPARLGQVVELPAVPDDAVVVASFEGLAPTLGDRLHSAVFRSPKYWFVLSAPAPDEPPHRFVLNNALQPHVVSMPRCLRDAWSTYDTRSFTSFVLRETKLPDPDSGPGRAFTVRLRSFRYECPA